jgi:hypothetical protein
VVVDDDNVDTTSKELLQVETPTSSLKLEVNVDNNDGDKSGHSVLAHDATCLNLLSCANAAELQDHARADFSERSQVKGPSTADWNFCT